MTKAASLTGMRLLRWLVMSREENSPANQMTPVYGTK